MGAKIKTLLASVLIAVGILFFALGFAVKFAIFPQLLEEQIYANLDLKPDTEAYDGFVEPPVPVYMNFRFFNVTNADKIKAGEKPKVQEVGPYVYREVRRKQNVLEVDEDKIKYGLYMEYHFDQGQTEAAGCSGCSKDDAITVVNPLLLVISELLDPIPDGATLGDVALSLGLDLSSLPPTLQDIIGQTQVSVVLGFLDQLMSGTSPLACDECKDDIVVTTTVDKLLYKGFPSGLIKSLLTIVTTLSQGLITEEQILSQLPPQISNGEFGVFKGKNATKLDSYYTINNGRYDKSKFLKFEEFNGKTSLPEEWWIDVAPTPSGQDSGETGICKDLYGNDGTQFPPFVNKDIRKWLFVGELCRSIWLDFTEDVEVRGIEAYRYRPPFSVFDMRNPDNYCYCPEFNQCAKRNSSVDEWNPIDCYKHCKDGFLRVGKCYGVPVIMSAPHFFNVDPVILKQIDGVQPVQELHDTYLDIEPTTGITLAAHKRIQVNFRMQPYRNFAATKSLPLVELFPVLWADEGADLDEENEKKFKDMVVTPSKVVNGLAIGVGMVLGAFLFVLGLFMIVKAARS